MKKILQLLCVSLFFIPNFALGQDKPFLDPSETKSNKVIVNYGVNIGIYLPVQNSSIQEKNGAGALLTSFIVSFKSSNVLSVKLVSSFIQKERNEVLAFSRNYIDLNPMISYNFSDKASVSLGPYFGVLLPNDMYDLAEEIDYGLTSSISYNLYKNISIDIGYSLGLSLIQEHYEYYDSYYAEVYDYYGEYYTLSGVYLSVGYLFK